MKKAFTLLFLCALPLFSRTVEDIVETKDGSSYKGKIVEEDTAAVAIQLQGGSVIRIRRTEISRLQYEANSNVPEAGIHRHDGFYLSMNLGLGGGRMDFEGSSSIDGSGSMLLTGVGIGLDIKIGWAVLNNLILSFDSWGNGPLEPSARIRGLQWFPTDSLKAMSLGMGPGLTYYFMPVNIFVGGSASIVGRFSLEYNDTQGFGSFSHHEHQSKDGFSLLLKAGKEWWVSKNWGLGVSINYAYTAAEDRWSPLSTGDNTYSGSFSAHDYSVKFNSTFN